MIGLAVSSLCACAGPHVVVDPFPRDWPTDAESSADIQSTQDVLSEPDVPAGNDVSVTDVTANVDSARGPVCDWGSCAPLEVCCGMDGPDGVVPRCASTCPTPSPQWCSGPEDCGGNPCCEHLSGPAVNQMGNQGIYCGTDANSCVPTLNVSSAWADSRVCHVNADCAPSTELPLCCHFPSGARLCLNPSLASYLGATCP